jgi:hypothetical protein
MSRLSPTRMTCTISSELLAELDDACWQSRVNRSEFVREALAIYLKNFHVLNSKINSPNEKALAAKLPALFSIIYLSINSLFCCLYLGG